MILPRPFFQLQTVCAIGGQPLACRIVGFGFSAAVGIHGNAGDQHCFFSVDPAQIFPRSLHHSQIGRRVAIGQKHGRRHTCIHHQAVIIAAERLGNIGGMQGLIKGMLCQKIGSHKACRAHQDLLFHDPLPTSFPVQGVFEKAAPPHHIIKVYYTLFAAGLQTRAAERKKARRPRKGPAGR